MLKEVAWLRTCESMHMCEYLEVHTQRQGYNENICEWAVM
jgi:hypothetical protein